MNLKTAGGKVPVHSGDAHHPWTLLPFPSRAEFDALYGKQIQAHNLPRYWDILTARAAGQTFADVARAQCITLERVRQIEAKFLRMMTRNYLKTKQA